MDPEDLELPKGFPIRPRDRVLPISNVARLMRSSLPESITGKISKNAKICMQEATERCLVEKRKTVAGEDIITSLQSLGFDNYVEPLRMYLARYRDSLKRTKQQHQRGASSPTDLFSAPSLPVQELEDTPPPPPPVPPLGKWNPTGLLPPSSNPWGAPHSDGVGVFLPGADAEMRGSLQGQTRRDAQQQLQDLTADPSLFLQRHHE